MEQAINQNDSVMEHLQHEIKKQQDVLNNLRRDGVQKIETLNNENSNIRRNKQLEKPVKDKLIAKNKESIQAAKEVRAQNAQEIKEKEKALISYTNEEYKRLIIGAKAKKKAVTEAADAELATSMQKVKDDKATKLSAEQTRYEAELQSAPKDDKNALKKIHKAHKSALNDINASFKQQANDITVKRNDAVDAEKDAVHSLYVDKFGVIDAANNRRLPFVYSQQQKLENYGYNFSLSKFFLSNGLYITIIILLIFAVIYYQITTGKFLFSLSTILLILNQVSPRMFLALGVAGLIVLAGTDLSVGRLVGLAAVVTGMLVTTSGTTGLTFFGTMSPNFSALPIGFRVVLAFILSIVLCSAISCFAGFFMAKFKMHPFISTLATQLMTFGILAGVTANTFTGSPDPGVKSAIAGSITIGTFSFPVMVIWAIIGIIVMWFIWNKTTFGKNMFAVGGNPEAASVSGISVFKVTMGVFLLAGIYYGIGGSIFGIYSGSVQSSTGAGMESDAIAACVVGGVSFSGGIGKISGVVIGAILFQAISVVLLLVGVTDANYQLAIKGLIIIAAVALDCAKYLKKK
jgi:methyl-galactoside transport system permease protein